MLLWEIATGEMPRRGKIRDLVYDRLLCALPPSVSQGVCCFVQITLSEHAAATHPSTVVCLGSLSCPTEGFPSAASFA